MNTNSRLPRQTRARRLATVGGILGISALVLSGCSVSSAPAASDDDTLTVAIWKGYGADIPWAQEDFKELTGATLEFQYIDSSQNLLDLMADANGAIDVGLPNVQYIGPGIDSGIFHALDESKLDNYDDIFPAFSELPEIRSDGELYGVPWTWGSTGLFYTTTEFPTAPDSVAALWDPANKGKIGLIDDPNVIIPTVALYLGEDPQNPDMEKIKPALAELVAQARLVYSSTDDLAKAIANGSVSLGIANSDGTGDIAAQGQADLAYTIPKESAVGWIDNWTIAKSTKKLDLAYEWVNYMTSDAFLTKWATDTDYHAPAPTNSAVLEALPADVQERLQADPDKVGDLALQLPQPADVLQSWADAWQEVKAG